MSSMDGMEHNMDEKRAKREIANLNERRRMQNINAGFHSLRTLLPQKHDGEKLSKAAILQHTATYIYQLEQEINKLLSQNSELKTLAGGSATNATNTNSPDWMKRLQSQPPDCPSCKRRKYENNHRLDIDSSPINGDGSSTESSSEHELNSNKFNRSKSKQNGNSRLSTDASALRKQLCRIEKELKDERRLRIMLQEELQYQGKTLNGNRQYNNNPSSALDQMADEVEVASESIEIEMQSCPASPPDMVIASNEQVITGGTTIYPSGHYQSQQIEIGQQQQQQRVQKQNAIALPIDVPFVAPHDVDSPTESSNNINKNTSNGSVVVLVDSNVMLVESNRNIKTTNANLASNSSTTNAGQKTQILQLVPNNSSSKHGGPTILTAKHTNLTVGNNCQLITIKKESSNEQANTSRQNLNTIVEAIRHVEGGYFNENTDKNNKMANSETEDSSNQVDIMLKTENNNDNNNHSESAKQNVVAAVVESLPKSKTNVILNNAKIVTVSGVSNTSTSRIYQTISTANSSSSLSSPSSNTISTTTTTTTRPQIIQIQRPNVIVANSVEN
ncbi:transcription factor cropped [Dermatophagoides pteronyssinus]|uniref:transcription factor cropped n=1 Tax=Dermatophagoides pteronyssinus TaxID=6956 RepID=UPI003F679675